MTAAALILVAAVAAVAAGLYWHAYYRKRPTRVLATALIERNGQALYERLDHTAASKQEARAHLVHWLASMGDAYVVNVTVFHIDKGATGED